MAWGRRTSIEPGAWSYVAPAYMLGFLAIGLAAPAAVAQTTPPAVAEAPAEAPKTASKKPKTKPAAEEAKATKKDPAVAQQQIEAGAAALQAGKHDQAVQQFTEALTGGSLPAPLLARAHYQRGLAYRKQSKPALAISDLTQALWVKNGLNETDRADAMQNRIAAYRDAGLPDQADAEGTKSPAAPSTAATAAATRTAAADAATAPAPVSAATRTGSIPSEKPSAGLAPAPESAAPSSGGLSGFFGNLFGSSNNSGAAAPAPAQKAEVATSAWSAGTEVKASAGGSQRIKPAGQTAAAAEPTPAPLPWQKAEQQPQQKSPKVANVAPASAPTVAAPAKSAGRFALQVAQLKSREEAQAVADKLKQQLGPDLAGREASIVAVSAGGFGTLHRLSFGPFADAAEWKTLCPKLLKAGHDCQPLTQ